MAVIVFPCDCPKWTLIFFYSLRLQSRLLPLPFPTSKPFHILLALSQIHGFFFLIYCYIHVCTCIYILKYTDTTCSVCIMSLGCMFSAWITSGCVLPFSQLCSRERRCRSNHTQPFPCWVFLSPTLERFPPLPLVGSCQD